MGRALIVVVLFGVTAQLGAARAAEPDSQPLPVEAIGGVNTLPATYPANWLLADYIAAPSTSESKTEVLEIGDKGAVLKGQVPTHQFGITLPSPVLPEIYVAESYYERGNRGVRTDVVTIYDTRTLAAVGEIVLPGAKRGLFVKQPASFALTNGGRWGLVSNFTPAASVTVVDLEHRRVLGEVETPGCIHVFPTGARGFSSLCANGTALSFQLGADGKPVSQRESAAFNDLDKDPAFLAPAQVGAVSHFVTLGGRVRPVDLTGDVPKFLPPWDLADAALAAERWRPSGLQIAAGDARRLYVLMRPDAVEGSHKEGGTEVWAFDAKTHARLLRIKLKRASRSIAVTPGEGGRLVASGVENALDIYDPATGALLASSPVPAYGGAVLRTAR